MSCTPLQIELAKLYKCKIELKQIDCTKEFISEVTQYYSLNKSFVIEDIVFDRKD